MLLSVDRPESLPPGRGRVLGYKSRLPAFLQPSNPPTSYLFRCTVLLPQLPNAISFRKLRRHQCVLGANPCAFAILGGGVSTDTVQPPEVLSHRDAVVRRWLLSLLDEPDGSLFREGLSNAVSVKEFAQQRELAKDRDNGLVGFAFPERLPPPYQSGGQGKLLQFLVTQGFPVPQQIREYVGLLWT